MVASSGTALNLGSQAGQRQESRTGRREGANLRLAEHSAAAAAVAAAEHGTGSTTSWRKQKSPASLARARNDASRGDFKFLRVRPSPPVGPSSDPTRRRAGLGLFFLLLPRLDQLAAREMLRLTPHLHAHLAVPSKLPRQRFFSSAIPRLAPPKASPSPYPQPGTKLPFYRRRPILFTCLVSPIVITVSLGVLTLGLLAHGELAARVVSHAPVAPRLHELTLTMGADASTYREKHLGLVPVDPLALKPTRGGPKNLKIAEVSRDSTSALILARSKPSFPGLQRSFLMTVTIATRIRLKGSRSLLSSAAAGGASECSNTSIRTPGTSLSFRL